MTTLRNYQQDMFRQVVEAWRVHRSVMVQMPTGTGKTVLMGAVIDCMMPATVLVVAHRRELLEQIRTTVARCCTKAADGQMRVESIQKLTRGLTVAGAEGEMLPSLVIIDEAHHAQAKTYRVLWERFPRAKFLGLTATPCRLNGQGFDNLFDVLLQSHPIPWFIQQGWLSDFDYVSAAPDSQALRLVSTLRKRGADGDYQGKEMSAVMDVPESIAHLYEAYHHYADGKKGIVYAIDRQHALHIAEHYRQKGVDCAVIDSRTPDALRRQLVADYRCGRLQVLVNVDIFGEGFDVPEVEFIQLARPTLSLSKYLQQVGRGMRISPGKEAVLILDMVGLYQLFGLPTDERDWTLTFSGQASGKATPGTARPIVIRNDMEEKQLVNLEMVQIRRRSESLDGVLTFILNGRYGVMRDGKITCPPVFSQIQRLDDKHFYALGQYPYQAYNSRTTVIDQRGLDLHAQLYGKVVQRGEFFHANDINGGQIIWDAVGQKYYYGAEPQFEKLGSIDILRTNDGSYSFRYSGGVAQSLRFDKREVLFNKYLAIANDVLIVKREDGYRVFHIYGYTGNSVLAYSTTKRDRFQVSWDGKVGRHAAEVPDDFSLTPNRQAFRLHYLREH